MQSSEGTLAASYNLSTDLSVKLVWLNRSWPTEDNGEPNTAFDVHTGRGGWQTFRTTASGLSGVAPFELSVTYMG
ncbi:hypothetical protein CI15_33865 [Paraburkholderia monticola]|uniref:Uncharacterized protein n=1 Tax=Paraburkholderia monticola TaxID=1399968 RepID=A0A149PBW4_9BURK|nr:hypothetical protein CI15_33865 [Paraburkholderia monticola]